MKHILSVLLAVCCTCGTVGSGTSNANLAGSQENPSHELLRTAVRRALDPAHIEGLEEVVDAAVADADSRQVRSIVGLAYSDFGAKAMPQSFNRLKGSYRDKFVPRLIALLGLDPRHQADVLETAFAADRQADSVGVWRLHKLLYRPKGSSDGGTRLSCMMVHGTETDSYDVIAVVSATAKDTIGGDDLLVMETKPVTQLGRPDQREARLARTSREVGLTESDMSCLMAFTELNCLRKLGDYFGVVFDS